MADPPRHPDSKDDTGDDNGAMPGRGSTTGTPRWVKVFGIIAIVVILVFVILLIFGRGHGPRRHMPSGGGGYASSSIVIEDHAPPEGGHG